MPDHRRATCKHCRRHKDDAGELSWSGLCSECGHKLLLENVYGLHTMTGYPRDRWARGMILSAGGVLPERLQTGS